MQQGGGAPLRCCHRAADLQCCRSTSRGLRGKRMLYVRNRAGCPEAPSWSTAAEAGTGCTAVPCTGPRFMTLCGARIRYRLWTAPKCGVRQFETHVGAISHVALDTSESGSNLGPPPRQPRSSGLPCAGPRPHKLTLSGKWVWSRTQGGEAALAGAHCLATAGPSHASRGRMDALSWQIQPLPADLKASWSKSCGLPSRLCRYVKQLQVLPLDRTGFCLRINWQGASGGI